MSHELVVLDIDRTLINTTNLSQLVARPIADILHLSDMQVESMLTAIADREGKVFDFLKWLHEELQLDDSQLTLLDDASSLTRGIIAYYTVSGMLSAQFVDMVLVPGVLELFTAIEKSGAKALLLTAGGKVLQSIKVALVQLIAEQLGSPLQLDDSVVVSVHASKTELIAACFTENGFAIDTIRDMALVYTISDASVYTAIQHATIIDDKYENLLPPDPRITGVAVCIEGDRTKSRPDEARYRAMGLSARKTLWTVAKEFAR